MKFVFGLLPCFWFRLSAVLSFSYELLKAQPWNAGHSSVSCSEKAVSFLLFFFLPKPQFFLERERAAILAEAKTDDLISEAPKPALDQSGEWQETSGEIQWVASETNNTQTEKKEEEDEELDLNKGGHL